jgi:hypothetical protein
LGYKTHLTETCSRRSEALRLIVHLETTPSTLQDVQVPRDAQRDPNKQAKKDEQEALRTGNEGNS